MIESNGARLRKVIGLFFIIQELKIPCITKKSYWGFDPLKKCIFQTVVCFEKSIGFVI